MDDSELGTKECAAYGCPMLGTISGGGKGYCRYHYGANVSDFDKITFNVRHYQKLIDRVILLNREWPNSPLCITNLYVWELDPSLSKTDDENHLQYVERLKNFLKQAIKYGSPTKAKTRESIFDTDKQ